MNIHELNSLPKLKNKINLIGLCGESGVGKTTIANYIAGRYEDTYIENFADALKRTCSQLYGIGLENFYNEELKEVVDPKVGVSPRQIIQNFGTDIIRAKAPDFWVNRLNDLLDGIRRLPEEGDYCEGDTVVIGDVRFQNEIDWINLNGGLVIRIRREKEKNWGDAFNHITEKLENLKDFQAEFWNTSLYNTECFLKVFLSGQRYSTFLKIRADDKDIYQANNLIDSDNS